ncbi:MAG: CYTH and CHAD domain-containing protein [Actinomycetales bacterium]|nr:CYTH and CHAD domain-containing protein [Actinomycetales bacterium]
MRDLAVHREVERKVRVSPDFPVPDLVAAGLVVQAQPGVTHQMTAVYHDTEDLRLLRWRTTLRRREGGSDEGWHLKLPVLGGEEAGRDEVHMPLWAGSTGFVPAELADIVAPLARGERLIPVAEVHTTRRPVRLLDADGQPMAELVDDRVIVRSRGGNTLTEFRELEIEAHDADDDAALALIDAVAALLVSRGGEVSTMSKAASALGHLAAAPPDIEIPAMPGRKDLATGAIRASIAIHARHLVLADVAVRRGLDDSVHQLRVAARRLRSVLRTFEPLLDADWAQTLEQELGWLAAEMGVVRDTEVLMARLDAHAMALGSLDESAARQAVDQALQQRLIGARGSALAALRSERHDLLLDDLVQASHSPALASEAYLPCEIALPRLVGRAWRRLDKAVRRLEIHGDSAQWHAARIKAKRARYAAEAVAPIFGEQLERLARRLSSVTEILGSHQDATVAQDTVRDLALRADPASAFALGRLFEIEREAEVACREDFIDLWPAVRRAARHVEII